MKEQKQKFINEFVKHLPENLEPEIEAGIRNSSLGKVYLGKLIAETMNKMTLRNRQFAWDMYQMSKFVYTNFERVLIKEIGKKYKITLL